MQGRGAQESPVSCGFEPIGSLPFPHPFGYGAAISHRGLKLVGPA
jgi:hypothetical protein